MKWVVSILFCACTILTNGAPNTAKTPSESEVHTPKSSLSARSNGSLSSRSSTSSRSNGSLSSRSNGSLSSRSSTSSTPRSETSQTSSDTINAGLFNGIHKELFHKALESTRKKKYKAQKQRAEHRLIALTNALTTTIKELNEQTQLFNNELINITGTNGAMTKPKTCQLAIDKLFLLKQQAQEDFMNLQKKHAELKEKNPLHPLQIQDHSTYKKTAKFFSTLIDEINTILLYAKNNKLLPKSTQEANPTFQATALTTSNDTLSAQDPQFRHTLNQSIKRLSRDISDTRGQHAVRDDEHDCLANTPIPTQDVISDSSNNDGVTYNLKGTIVEGNSSDDGFVSDSSDDEDDALPSTSNSRHEPQSSDDAADAITGNDKCNSAVKRDVLEDIIVSDDEDDDLPLNVDVITDNALQSKGDAVENIIHTAPSSISHDQPEKLQLTKNDNVLQSKSDDVENVTYTQANALSSSTSHDLHEMLPLTRPPLSPPRQRPTTTGVSPSKNTPHRANKPLKESASKINNKQNAPLSSTHANVKKQLADNTSTTKEKDSKSEHGIPQTTPGIFKPQLQLSFKFNEFWNVLLSHVEMNIEIFAQYIMYKYGPFYLNCAFGYTEMHGTFFAIGLVYIISQQFFCSAQVRYQKKLIITFSLIIAVQEFFN